MHQVLQFDYPLICCMLLVAFDLLALQYNGANVRDTAWQLVLAAVAHRASSSLTGCVKLNAIQQFQRYL
jgi:hypothetical protein